MNYCRNMVSSRSCGCMRACFSQPCNVCPPMACAPAVCPPCPVPPSPACFSPVTGAAVGITAGAAQIMGNAFVSGSSPVTQVGVEYAANPALTGSQTVFSAVTPVFNVPLSGLSSGTTYYYRAVVLANGSRCVGEIRSFTTTGTPGVVSGTPINIAASTATIQGSSFANLPQLPTEAGIEYATSPTLAGSVNMPAAQAVTPFNVPLSGLGPLTTYYYRAYAVSGGVRYVGSILNFNTLA